MIHTAGMSNVLDEEKKQQVLALGRLGWSLRRIEGTTGVRRETASRYLKAAGVPVRSRGGRPREWPAEPATTGQVSTDPASPEAATTGGASTDSLRSRPATTREVSTDPESVPTETATRMGRGPVSGQPRRPSLGGRRVRARASRFAK